MKITSLFLLASVLGDSNWIDADNSKSAEEFMSQYKIGDEIDLMAIADKEPEVVAHAIASEYVEHISGPTYRVVKLP